MLQVANRSKKPRKIRAFSFLEYTSEWHTYHDQFNLQYSQYIAKCEWLGNLIAQSQSGNLAEDLAHFENRDQSRHTFLGLVALKPPAMTPTARPSSARIAPTPTRSWSSKANAPARRPTATTPAARCRWTWSSSLAKTNGS